jgi:hypothetical protein
MSYVKEISPIVDFLYLFSLLRLLKYFNNRILQGIKKLGFFISCVHVHIFYILRMEEAPILLLFFPLKVTMCIIFKQLYWKHKLLEHLQPMLQMLPVVGLWSELFKNMIQPTL